MGLAAFNRMRRLQVEEEEKKLVNFDDFTVPELKDLAKERNLKGYSTLSRDELIELLGGK